VAALRAADEWKATEKFVGEALEQRTVNNYKSKEKQYSRYCAGLNIEEADKKSLAMFVQRRSKDGRASSTIRGDVSAVSNKFRFDESNPAQSELVKMAKKSATKKAPEVQHREPLTRSHFIRLSLTIDESKFLDVRDFLMMLIGWRGFLRSEEIVNICDDEMLVDSFSGLASITDLMPPTLVGKEILWLKIASSKTNPQKRKRNYADRRVENVIVGPDVDLRIDPMRWYRLFIEMRDKKQSAFFHRADSRDEDNDNEGFLRPASVNHIVKKRLISIAVDPDRFGGHSIRAGGATEAAKQQVELRLIKHHGRWKSDAVFIYIHDNHVGEMHLNAAMGGWNGNQSSASSSTASSTVNPPKPTTLPSASALK
jgi:hypothetical protein